jgi:hypothetical protein
MSRIGLEDLRGTNTSGQAIGSGPMDILNAPGAEEIADCFATYRRRPAAVSATVSVTAGRISARP